MTGNQELLRNHFDLTLSKGKEELKVIVSRHLNQEQTLLDPKALNQDQIALFARLNGDLVHIATSAFPVAQCSETILIDHAVRPELSK